mgnify:FL=1
MSPESLRNREFSKSSDIWSFGCLNFEIFNRTKPYPEIENITQVAMEVISKGLFPKFPEYCPSEMKNLLSNCFHQNPSSRISTNELFIELEKIEKKFSNY